MYEDNYLASRLAHRPSLSLDSYFLVTQDDERRITFDQFFKEAEGLCGQLRARGLQPGDRVLIYAAKAISGLELYFACVLGGFVYVPINPSLPISDLAYFVEDADPAAVVCDRASEMVVADVLRERSTAILATVTPDDVGTIVFRDVLEIPTFETTERACEDIAAILYTSGTTGRPKGAIHTHRSLWSNAETLAAYWRFSKTDILIHALPIFHLHGLFTATNVALASGAVCRFHRTFDADAVLQELDRSTVLMGVPPFYMELLKRHGLAHAARGMRLFISGSAPMLPQTHAEWHARTGRQILERYGMTEASMIASNPYDGDRKPNTVGFPLPGIEVRIVDERSGRELGPGEIGMIQIRGPNLFSGYWRKPEKTAADMAAGGFFVSGDFGRFDETGYLSVLCRAKDAILSSGGIVLPKELETLLDEDANVFESAVVGVLAPDGSQIPIAICVAKPGAVVDVTALRDRMALLPSHQNPTAYFIVPELPRNAMGKVQKAALRERYADCVVGGKAAASCRG